jgi:hypothetical protein
MEMNNGANGKEVNKLNKVNIGVLRVNPSIETEIQGIPLKMVCNMRACMNIYTNTGVYLMLNAITIALLCTPAFHFDFAACLMEEGGNPIDVDQYRQVADLADVARVAADMKEIIDAFIPSDEQMKRLEKLAEKDKVPVPNSPPMPTSLESGVSEYEDSDLLPKISGD